MAMKTKVLRQTLCVIGSLARLLKFNLRKRPFIAVSEHYECSVKSHGDVYTHRERFILLFVGVFLPSTWLFQKISYSLLLVEVQVVGRMFEGRMFGTETKRYEI